MAIGDKTRRIAAGSLARFRSAAVGTGVRWPIVLSGAVVGLAMPGLGPWLMLLPAFAFASVWLYQSSTPFRDGWLFGLTWFGASLYWIVYVVHVYGYVPIVIAWIPWVLLSAYMALFPAVAAWIASRLPRAAWWPAWPLLLAGFEDVRGQFLTGFSWSPVGHAVATEPGLAAPAAIFGVTGLGAVIVLAAAGLGGAWSRRSGIRRSALVSGVVGLLLWVISATVVLQSDRLDKSREPLSFALIQGNIAQDQKWSPSVRRLTLQRYEDLTRAAVEEGPVDLIVWPETAAPFYFQQPGPLRRWVQRIAADLQMPLLFGAPAFRFVAGDEEPRLFNRAYLLSANGEPVGQYDKTHLVPFGEYVPLKPLLFFVDKMVTGIGSFTHGKTRAPITHQNLRLGVLICYEAIFPYEVRQFIDLGADVLVQITNDAWFGETAAPIQHLAMAQLRSIENGVPVLRAANTGITAWIDPTGRVHQSTKLFRKGWVRGSVHYGQPTFFRAYGAIWHVWWLAVAFAGLLWGARQWWNTQRQRADLDVDRTPSASVK